MHDVNNSGKIFFSHTKLNGRFTLRLVLAQTNLDENHADEAFNTIKEFSKLINT